MTRQSLLATQKWKIRIPQSEISYLRFLLEAYEGIAGLSTLDPAKGLLEISVPPGRRDEWEALLNDLQKRILVDVVHDPSQ